MRKGRNNYKQQTDEINHGGIALTVPIWLNGIGALVTGSLAVMLWKENIKSCINKKRKEE